MEQASAQPLSVMTLGGGPKPSEVRHGPSDRVAHLLLCTLGARGHRHSDLLEAREKFAFVRVGRGLQNS